MPRHLAQRVDGAFELRHRLRVFLRHDQIDLVGEPVDGIVEADQLLGRRQPAQRVAHFGEAVFDAGERAGVGAVLAAFGDALAKPRDLLFDRLDLAPRHRLVELGADFDQFAAQRVDRFFHARPAQGFDLVGDAAQLIFQAGNVLRRQRRTRRLLCRGGRGNGSGRCRRHGGRRHLLRGLRHRRRLLRHRRLRLRLRPRGRRRRLAIERAPACGNLGHRALERRRQLHVWRCRLVR